MFYSFAILVTPGWILGCFCIQSVAVSPSYASMLVNEGKGQLLVELGEFSPHGAPERISGTLSVLGTTLRATGVADVWELQASQYLTLRVNCVSSIVLSAFFFFCLSLI